VEFRNGCTNGQCVSPNVCKCTTGYNGNDCSIPVCSPACAHGVCAGPNSCNCFGTGYTNCALPPNICACDEDECLRANPVCDPLSKCTNTIGSYNCSSCPAGYQGTPYLTYPDAPTSYANVTGGCIPITTTGQPQSSVVPVTSTNDIKNAAMELSPFLSVITSLLMVLLALHYSS